MALRIEIGTVEAVFRYPVKSMRGETLAAANMGWHGIEGDRRLAFRRVNDRTAFPWLTASKLPDLVRFAPLRNGGASDDALPTHVGTPDGQELPVFGEVLDAEISRRHGAPVQLLQFKNGIFDDASISVITTETVREIGELAGRSIDARRFRPNIVIRSTRGVPFEEDDWLGGVLTFGDNDTGPSVAVTMRDPRCVMVNLDPDGGPSSPEILKTVVRVNGNNAGLYATVTRAGRIAVGQPIVLHR